MQHLGDPRAAGIDEDARGDLVRASVAMPETRPPTALDATRRHQLRAGEDRRATPRRIARVEHDEPRVVDPAIGIDEGGVQPRAQRHAIGMAGAIHRLRARQLAPPADVVVEEEPGADHPARPEPRIMRQHEAQRAHDVPRIGEQHLALAQRLAHQAELAVFEIAQAAMDELARGRGGGAGEIALLAQNDAEPAPRGVARDPGTVDAAADHQQIDFGRRRNRARRHLAVASSPASLRNPRPKHKAGQPLRRQLCPRAAPRVPASARDGRCRCRWRR